MRTGTFLRKAKQNKKAKKCDGCGQESYGHTICEMDECLNPICALCAKLNESLTDGQISACEKCHEKSTGPTFSKYSK